MKPKQNNYVEWQSNPSLCRPMQSSSSSAPRSPLTTFNIIPNLFILTKGYALFLFVDLAFNSCNNKHNYFFFFFNSLLLYSAAGLRRAPDAQCLRRNGKCSKQLFFYSLHLGGAQACTEAETCPWLSLPCVNSQTTSHSIRLPCHFTWRHEYTPTSVTTVRKSELRGDCWAIRPLPSPGLLR